jgi:AcrR family transcriptional regulator
MARFGIDGRHAIAAESGRISEPFAPDSKLVLGESAAGGGRDMTITIDDERRAQNRAQIAEAALGLLIEDGEDRLTMRAIATRLGVQASSLYTYVRDKDDLLHLVVERALGEPEIGRGDWESCTRATVDRVVRIIADNPGTACALRAAPALAAEMLRAQFADAMRDAPFDETTRQDAANALGTLLLGLVVWPDSRRHPSERDVNPSDIRAPCEVLLSGIALTTRSIRVIPPSRRDGGIATAGSASTGKWHRATG